MKFYAFKWHRRNDAETDFLPEKGFNVGSAEHCPLCGAPVTMLAWLPPFRVELQLRGPEFGDLTSVHGGDFLISQKLRDVYYRYGMTGLLGFDPVEVINVTNKSRRRLRSGPPMYFRVHAMRGQMALDMAASGFEWVDPPTCPQCRSGNIKRWRCLVLEHGTWTGEDVFAPRGLTGEIMVSERFKDACERHGIKNAEFTPADQAGHDFYPGEDTEETRH